MIQRATSVLGVLLLAGCGSSPQPVKCDPPPGTSGSLTAAYLGQTYALSCFSATLDGGLVIASPYPNSGDAPVRFEIDFWPAEPDIYLADGGVLVGASCAWQAGKTVSLGSSCLSVAVAHFARGGWLFVPKVDWTLLGGRLTVGLPAPPGTLSVVQWPVDAGQPVGISFSSDAALLPAQALGESFAPIGGSLAAIAQ